MTQSIYVPVCSSLAGRCLTSQNWRETGVEIASFSLAELLIKPGQELLSKVNSLADYVGWTGRLIIDARLPKSKKTHGYALCSLYDGTRSEISVEELLHLINHLRPDLVILPVELAHLVNELRPQILPAMALGEEIAWPNEVDYQISDTPALDAYQGLIYDVLGKTPISNPCQAIHFAPIDSDCGCPTCQQGYTRAYLHHLFIHTPLLCQRLLIQHNVYAGLNSRYDVDA